MSAWSDYSYELSGPQKEALDKANDYAIDKYCAFRKKGTPKNLAYLYALAWGRNSAEQAERRCAHDTGVDRRENWRHAH